MVTTFAGEEVVAKPLLPHLLDNNTRQRASSFAERIKLFRKPQNLRFGKPFSITIEVAQPKAEITR